MHAEATALALPQAEHARDVDAPHRFGILGSIEVGAGGSISDRVPRGRTLSLLALLLIHRGSVVHVDRALDELWEVARPRHGRKAVHVVASRLRSALGEALLVSRGGGYALRMAPGELDADRFERLLRDGQAQLAAGEPWEAAATLTRAARLWRGPALADVAHARFAHPEIARLEELRLACVSDRIDADLACGRSADVVGELEALVQQHPLRERLRGQQMIALYRAGRQAEALNAYRKAYAALRDGLGIEPSPKLRALESAILSHELPAVPPAARHKPLAVDSRRLVTCVFAQLANADEEAGHDAESVRAMLERFHDAAAAICAEHDGVVAESRSDAVLAVFGAPVPHEDSAQRALRTARALVARMREPALGLRVRCGVATGEVVAAAQRGTQAVIGEPVGCAERLGRAAARDEIRLDAPTWRVVRHAARATAIGTGGFRLDAFDQDAPAIRRRLDRPLVGRAPELCRLRDAFARVAATATARLMVVVGEPGIGKSRLVGELEAVVGDRATVLTARCPAFARGMTYGPLRAIVEQASGERSIDELAASLDVPRPAVRQVAVAVGLQPGTVVEDTGRAFLRLVDGLARRRPLVLVLDDAHLAEPALLLLLADVVSRLRGAPVLIVWAARRDVLDERHPDWEALVGPENVLELGPLSRSATATLIEAIDHGRLRPAEELRISEAAGGNPLFIEQLVAYVDERGVPVDALPPALHALLAARLDRLEATERSALTLGAVVGEAFETREVHALADGMARADLERACERLAGRELLLLGDDGTIRFRHGVVREVAYASLAKTARARLHEQHAAWLERHGAELPEADARIGLHLEAACRYAQQIAGAIPGPLATAAGRRLTAAARVARARSDVTGEIGFLDRAVALFGPEQHEGAELMPTLVAALIEAGEFSRAERLAQRAVAASASLRLPALAARSAVERERVRLYRHPESFRVPAATALAGHASRTLRDDLGLARAEFLMADIAWLTGDTVAAYARAERMLGHARSAKSGADIATAVVFMTWCLIEGPCPVPQALARIDALGVEGTGLPAVELALMGCRAALMVMSGRQVDAGSVIVAASAGLAELQLTGVAVYVAMLAVAAATLVGDAAAAERAARDARTLVSDPGDQLYLALIQIDVANAMLAQDRLADAAAAIAGMDAQPASCDAQWVIQRHTARALLAARTGEPERGLEDAHSAVAAAERTSLTLSRANAHRTRAELFAAIGHTDAAAEDMRRALWLWDAKATTLGRFVPG